MKNQLIFSLILLCCLPIHAEDAPDVRTPKKFNYSSTIFISPGFTISLSGANQASHTHSAGPKHILEAVIFNFLSYRNQGQLYNISGGYLQRDNILHENFENYAYFSQPNEKKSPLGKLGIGYTTKSGEWTFDISSRRKNYVGQYVLGNDIPFEYYPGSLNYNWQESQYSIIRNHALSNIFMIQPQIGIRELKEDYKRLSGIGSYPIGKRQSSLQEKSHTYSQQAGLGFHINILENLRFKITGKVFQAISGKLQLIRNDTEQEDSIYYITHLRSKSKYVNSRGNEIEGEFSYSLKRINFFLGYSLTTSYREVEQDHNSTPTIVTNRNIQTEFIRYYYADYLSKNNNSTNDDPSYKPRSHTLRYFYFGASINF